MKINELINLKITWINHPKVMRYFYFENKNDTFLLRLNNFPDEPICTLIFGLEIYDLEEIPNNWLITIPTVSNASKTQ